MIVLDTNVLSEAMKPRASDRVRRWLNPHRYGQLATTTVSIAELRYGAELIDDAKHRAATHAAITEALVLVSRVLVLDEEAAEESGRISGRKSRFGRRMSESDSYIAGICAAHGATLATRNIKDFAGCGIDLVNPWDES